MDLPLSSPLDTQLKGTLAADVLQTVGLAPPASVAAASASPMPPPPRDNEPPLYSRSLGSGQQPSEIEHAPLSSLSRYGKPPLSILPWPSLCILPWPPLPILPWPPSTLRAPSLGFVRYELQLLVEAEEEWARASHTDFRRIYPSPYARRHRRHAPRRRRHAPSPLAPAPAPLLPPSRCRRPPRSRRRFDADCF